MKQLNWMAESKFVNSPELHDWVAEIKIHKEKKYFGDWFYLFSVLYVMLESLLNFNLFLN